MCPLWGVGRAFIGNRHAEPQVDRRFDSRLFAFSKQVCFCKARTDLDFNVGVVMKKSLCLFLVALLSAACSNPYYKFYQGNKYERKKSCEYLGSISSSNELQKLTDEGYSVMGESSFTSTGNEYSVDKMISACKAVGADAAVIVRPEYQRSENVMRTYYTYQPGQSYTINTSTQISGGYTGNIYGRYNQVGSYNGNFYGTDNTQTKMRSEGHLEAHPYMTTADRYIYRAFYLKKSHYNRKFQNKRYNLENKKEPVITIGQTKIYADNIEELAELLEAQQSQHPQTKATKTQLRHAVVDNLVGQELVKQECERQGITVSSERVELLIKQFKSQYKSEYDFQKALEKSNNTMAQFRKRIEDQLKSEELLGKEVPYEPEHDRSIRLKNYLKKLGKEYEVRYLDERYMPPDAIGL